MVKYLQTGNIVDFNGEDWFVDDLDGGGATFDISGRIRHYESPKRIVLRKITKTQSAEIEEV